MSLKIFLAAIGLILCILALVYFLTPKSTILTGNSLKAAEEKAEREYKAVGLPWEAKDVVGNFRPFGKSAMKIADAFPKLPKSFDDWFTPTHKKTFIGDFAVAERRLKLFNKALDQAKTILETKKRYFGWKLEEGLACLFPEFSAIKGYAKLFALRASLEAYRHKPRESMSDFKACVKLGELCSITPMLIGSLVHVAIDKIALKDLAEARFSLRNDAQFTKQSEMLVGLLTTLPSLRESLRTDTFLQVASGRNWQVDESLAPVLRESGWAPDPRMANYELRSAKFWTQVFKEVGTDWRDCGKIQSAIKDASQKIPSKQGISKELDALDDDIEFDVARIWYKVGNEVTVEQFYFKAIDYWQKHRTAPRKLSDLGEKTSQELDREIAISKSTSGFKMEGQIALPPQLQSEDPDENEPRQIEMTFPPTKDDHW